MAEINPCTPPRRKSDVGPRIWSQDSSGAAFSPLQRLRQGPTFQPPRRSPAQQTFHRTVPATVTELTQRSDVPHAATVPALEQEIAGLQKALAFESRQSREHFAVRRRLYQLQNAQAKQVHPQDVAPQEAADELEKVKAALEELRRGGEEEKIHRSQLEERVMREIEDLKSSPASPGTPMALTRSLSRQNLLAEERERKRFWANEQLHAEVQELQDALAELRVNCADEMEAARLKEHQALAATSEMKEQLSLVPAREEALQAQLHQAEERLLSETEEVEQLRRDVREQDEALASFWGLQSSYTKEVAEATRYREATCNLQEEIQSLSRSQLAEMRESSEKDEADLRRQVATLKGQLLPLEEKLWLRENQDLRAFQAVSSSLKQLPQSLEEEIGAPEDAASSTESSGSLVRSEWCTNTIQKLAAFASSVLQENAQLRWNVELAQAKVQSPRSQASADEAGGRSNVDLKGGTNGKSPSEPSGSTTASNGDASELRELREAQAKAEVKVKMLEKRLAKYEKSPVPSSVANGVNGAGPQSRLRSKLSEKKSTGPTARETTSPLKRRSPREVKSSPREVKSSPREVKNSPREVKSSPREVKSSPREVKSSPREAPREDSKNDRGSHAASAAKSGTVVALPAESLKGVESAVASSCLYNSDSSSSGPGPRGAYPPSPDSVSPELVSRWMGPFAEQSDLPQGCETQKGSRAEADSREASVSPSTTETSVEVASTSPQSAADLFARAEALCESQHFAEAAELFRCVLAALRTSADREAMRSVEAEVWAHLGVAMQSLDDIAAAIESYCQAVRMDPSLHVCFANLATLYMYLEDFQKAEEHISKALELEPQNDAYLEIKASMRQRPSRAVKQ